MILPFNYQPFPSARDSVGRVVEVNLTKTIDKLDWLTDIEPFGTKSKQGVVTKSLIFNNFYIVVKKAKNSKFDDITKRDFCVGISLNKILCHAPFFVRTLGCFEHKKQFYIATEFIDGINLKTFIQNKRSTFAEFLNILFQILVGLEIAQEKLNFSHYDLHTDNVILVPQKKPFTFSLYGYSYTMKHVYKPIMIDFGLSSVHTKGYTIGQKNLEAKGIYNRLSPGYDIYIFLLFCIDIAQSSNISVFKGITDLLLFFNLETALSVDILTNNHIRCLRKGVGNLIPNQFIKYLIQNYSIHLKVDIEPKIDNDSYLGKQPLSLRLKNVFDVELEPFLQHKIEYKKGFVKTLLNNIKIYYWYKEKINLSQYDIKNLLEVDKKNLQNLIDDLNLRIYPSAEGGRLRPNVRSPQGRAEYPSANDEDDTEVIPFRSLEETAPSITSEQKNFFFVALEYYHLILNLELYDQYPFYKKWLADFKDTFVFKNIFKQLNQVLHEERLKRLCNPA